MEKIYIIKKYTYNTKITDILKFAFTDKEQAKKFVISLLDKEDTEKTEKAYKRGLITEYEFLTDKCNYEIKEMEKWG